MHILYIEDNRDDAALVNRYVQTTEHELTVVSTVDEARDILSSGVDLILLDVLLENKREGIDFANELRDQGIAQPLVAVTALSTSSDRQKYSEVGFDSILSKPFTINELADLINYYA
jgi:DNA-binding response OmpR family regulator